MKAASMPRNCTKVGEAVKPAPGLTACRVAGHRPVRAMQRCGNNLFAPRNLHGLEISPYLLLDREVPQLVLLLLVSQLRQAAMQLYLRLRPLPILAGGLRSLGRIMMASFTMTTRMSAVPKDQW